MRLSDLKSGMLVTARDGSSFVAAKGSCIGDFLFSPYGCMALDDFSEDFSHKADTQLDIVRVEAPYVGELFSHLERYTASVWVDGVDRDEDDPLFCLKNYALSVYELEKIYNLVQGSKHGNIPQAQKHLDAFRLFREGVKDLEGYLEEVRREKG